MREYAINSPADLDAYLMEHPAMADKYVDLDLYYLPISTASALKSVMPILAPDATARDHIHVVQASDLTADMIKRTNVIYIGYLSGLGLLRDVVFSGSRFSVGDTYDDLVDNVGKRTYVSQAGGPEEGDTKMRDFGYFSTFTGPGGNKIMIIAGTRDIGVMQTAEAVTEKDSLDAMTGKAQGNKAYEALYQVKGIKRSNLSGGLLLGGTPAHRQDLEFPARSAAIPQRLAQPAHLVEIVAISILDGERETAQHPSPPAHHIAPPDRANARGCFVRQLLPDLAVGKRHGEQARLVEAVGFTATSQWHPHCGSNSNMLWIQPCFFSGACAIGRTDAAPGGGSSLVCSGRADGKPNSWRSGWAAP